jgi:hypothetical protein
MVCSQSFEGDEATRHVEAQPVIGLLRPSTRRSELGDTQAAEVSAVLH